MRKLLVSVCLVIASAFFLGGCASQMGGKDYPEDTALMIGKFGYLINTVKCAEIKSIGDNGEMDCYDANGRQTGSVTPVGEWRVRFVKERLGYEWASPQHQALLFDAHHNGGMERSIKGLISSAQQAYSNYSALNSMADSLKKSGDMEIQAGQMKLKGAQAYVSGGMSAWQAHQINTAQWHLENARYFQEKMNSN